MTASIHQPVITEELCIAFTAAADGLAHRRAHDMGDASIAPFIQLRWMEWHRGSLRVTTLGRMALAQTQSRSTDALPAH